MPAEYVRNYTKILQGGIWCILRIEYLQPEDADEDALADIFDDAPKPKPKKKSRKRGPQDSPLPRGELEAHSDAEPRFGRHDCAAQ